MGLTLSTSFTTETSPYDLDWEVVVKQKTEEVEINPFTEVAGDDLRELNNSEVFV